MNLPKSKFELEFNQGSEYGEEDKEAVLRVLAANAPSCGAEVLAFEREFAEYNHSRFAVTVGNCTQGLEISVKAALNHVKDVDQALHKQQPLSQQTNSPLVQRNEVIVPAISWISTASAAGLAGAVVKFADVTRPSVCVDVNSIRSLVTDKTAAVLIVHMYGRPVDGVEELAEWLRDRRILLIEDCAHAAGSCVSDGRRCGTIGDVAVFSFHQQKNMVTLGEGGCCITNNQQLRDLLVGYRSLCCRAYDPRGKYLSIDSETQPMGQRFWLMDFADLGHNFRMTDMQAAVGRVQLKKLEQWNHRRRDIAHRLHTELSQIPGLQLPNIHLSDAGPEANGGWVHSWHLFHVLVTEDFPLTKEAFLWQLLQQYGVKAWSHYAPMHLSSAFRSRGLGQRGDCPVAEQLFEEYVSLPIHPRLSDSAVTHLIHSVTQLSQTPRMTDRPTQTPLLEALLRLSDPVAPINRQTDSHHMTNISSSVSVGTNSKNNGRDDAIVQRQLSRFLPQIQQAKEDNFFFSNANNTVTGADYNTSSVLVSRAPGRLDLMGGNDDYTGGLVFECTIAEATFVAAQAKPASSSSDPLIVIRNRQLDDNDLIIPVQLLHRAVAIDSSNYNNNKNNEDTSHKNANNQNNTVSGAQWLAKELQWLMCELQSQQQKTENVPPARWPLYVVGVLYWLSLRYPQQMFQQGQGLSLLLWTEVPLNRGVSSSASVEVAVMKVAAKVFNIDLNGAVLATACQWVENQVCSSACGLMDQMAVTLGAPFMAMQCQPAKLIHPVPPLPALLTVYAIDSGVSHEVSGLEYEAARAAAFMGYKMICSWQGIAVVPETSNNGHRSDDTNSDNGGAIPRYTDEKYDGYLANLSVSTFARCFEARLPETMLGRDFVEQFGPHVDPATPVLPDHVYHIRANTRYAVYENQRVTVFSQLLLACSANNNAKNANILVAEEEACVTDTQRAVFVQLGELMYQSHDAYTECGLGSSATSLIVDLVREIGPQAGLYGAKITGGGAGGTVAILGLKSAKHVFESQVVQEYARRRGLNTLPHVFAGSSMGADAFGVRPVQC